MIVLVYYNLWIILHPQKYIPEKECLHIKTAAKINYLKPKKCMPIECQVLFFISGLIRKYSATNHLLYNVFPLYIPERKEIEKKKMIISFSSTEKKEKISLKST